ncbi:MAG: aminotransferase class V-fold PLP-dependent enzyme [Actinobacteria bacterium]|nr:aminotransferase class V-fold PLP-dependent enzyme [Actinomycetota bacterium]
MFDRTAQDETPLTDALLEYRASAMAAFHTPGHKLGAGAPADLVEAVGRRMLEADFGIANGLEDTQESRGLLARAETLAAQAWGADIAHFLVNGSTSGVQALVLAVAGPGDMIIVPRNSHKSLLAGLIFSGAHPVYVEPTVHLGWGVAANVPTRGVLAALDAHPDAKAVFVTSPSYNGFCADVEALAEHAHAAGIPLIVDQAWGAHLRFCSKLPVDAMTAGADASVTSVHKLLSGLSQASIVLACRGRVDTDRLRAMVRMLQTTSPLAPILASIDSARAQMVADGERLWSDALALAARARSEIGQIEGMTVLSAPAKTAAGVCDFDPVRLTVSAAALGLTGYELEMRLRRESKVAVEAADPRNVVLNVTFGDSDESIDRLVAALQLVAESAAADLGERLNAEGRAARPAPPGPADPAGPAESLGLVVPTGLVEPLPVTPAMSPRDAFFATTRTVLLDEAVGEVSGEMVIPYPPGIPVLAPGERITAEVAAYLKEAALLGLSVHGPHDTTLATLRVVQR